MLSINKLFFELKEIFWSYEGHFHLYKLVSCNMVFQNVEKATEHNNKSKVAKPYVDCSTY